MKTIAKAKKGWFIFSYAIGVMYFIYYLLWHEKSYDAQFANIMLLVLAHFLTIGASSICEKHPVRVKLLWRTLAIFVALFSCFIFFTPEVMGLVGGYALFCGIGFVHTKLIKEQEMFSHIKRAERQEDASEFSDKQWKYIFWIGLSLVPLFFCYWNI